MYAMNVLLSNSRPIISRITRLITSSIEVDFLLKRSIHSSNSKLISLKNIKQNQNKNADYINQKYDNIDEPFDYQNRPYQISESTLKKYKLEEQKFNGKLIYVGSLTSQLKTAKLLSLSSSFLGLALLPFINDTLSSSGLFAKLFVFGTSGFFIFVTPLFSQFLGSRYVSRLFYNYDEKKFTAILFSFFMHEYKLEFELNDVYVPDMPGPFSTVQLRTSNFPT